MLDDQANVRRTGTQVSPGGQSRVGAKGRFPTRSVERRGRGLRGMLLTPSSPGRKSPAQKFDAVVLAAFSPIDERWSKRLRELDIAVDEVPMVRAINPDTVSWPPEIVADGPVPLSRLVPAGLDKRGKPTRARIVLFRRALELRADSRSELLALVHNILVQQVATYLGVDPEEVSPVGDGNAG